MNWDAMAVVGQVARAHGIRGQVIVNPDTDFLDERFRPGAELFVLRGGRVEPIVLTTVRFQQGRPVVGIEGIDDMNAATALAGVELRVPLAELSALPAGTYYRHDLVGCEVQTATGQRIGAVRAVEGTLDGSRLVVDTPQGDALVPLVAAFCPEVDIAARRIIVSLPEGLLDLNR